MSRTIQILSLGELLVDFTPAGCSPQGMPLLEQNPGGAPANVCCAVQRLGGRSAFVGKVGDDLLGRFLRQALEQEGVDTQGLLTDPDAFTTLAFVALDGQGERQFSFARKPGADTRLSPQELLPAWWQRAQVFHFGSLSLTQEPARSATLRALELARQAGCLISYDPNYRAPLWPSQAQAQAQMSAVLPQVQLLKCAAEEAELLTGQPGLPPVQAAQALLGRGPQAVVLTLGGQGALFASRRCQVTAPALSVPVADTTGAGDCFWGAFLLRLLETGAAPQDLTPDQAASCLRFACAAAACCVQGRGAIPSLPRRAAVEALL